MKKPLAEPVVQYLKRLESELKRRQGVVPEDALCDAREFLQREHDTFDQAGVRSIPEVFNHLVDTFGQPAEVAAQYEDAAVEFIGQTNLGLSHAPGWRVCCTRCGRSAPAKDAGITRIGAISWHKYTLGWCRDCQWFRWLRIARDIERPNLTRSLGTATTAEKLRATSHWPAASGLLTILFATLFVAGAIATSIFLFGTMLRAAN